MPTAAVAMPGFAADLRGKGSLIARADGDLRHGGDAAGTAIDEIDAAFPQQLRELHGITDGPAAVEPVGAGEPHRQRQCGRHDAAEITDDAEQ